MSVRGSGGREGVAMAIVDKYRRVKMGGPKSLERRNWRLVDRSATPDMLRATSPRGDDYHA